MTTFILLRIENDDEAQRLLDDMQEYPGEPLLTPTQENEVYATLVRTPSPVVPGDVYTARDAAQDRAEDDREIGRDDYA